MRLLADVPLFFTHLFPWPLLAVGGSMSWKALRQIVHARQSLRWPNVQGKVVLAKVEVTDTGGDYPHNLFCPVIEYRYTVNGVTRNSRHLAIVDLNPGGEARAEAIVKRYQAGKTVKVYHSPSDPEQAILEPGCRWPMMGRLVCGLLFLLSGLALLLVFGRWGPAQASRL